MHRFTIFCYLALAACALRPQEPIPPSPVPDDPSLAGITGAGPEMEERLRVSGMWIPLMGISPDLDEDEPNQGPGFDANLEAGSGFGIQAGVDKGFGNLRGTFVTAKHRELNLGGGARTGLAVGELNFTLLAGEPAPIQAYVELGGGIGAGWIDFDRNYSDVWGAVGQLQTRVGVNLGNTGSIELGAAGFILGYPGETIGSGGYLLISASLRF